MADIITGVYLGNKKVELRHEFSGTMLLTDAPRDNQGDGTSFSPTDLTVASLGSCMMTTMALAALREGADLTGMRMQAEKIMGQGPRRIAEIKVEIHMPRSLDERARQKMEATAKTCPVSQSLSPNTKVTLEFKYDV